MISNRSCTALLLDRKINFYLHRHSRGNDAGPGAVVGLAYQLGPASWDLPGVKHLARRLLNAWRLGHARYPAMVHGGKGGRRLRPSASHGWPETSNGHVITDVLGRLSLASIVAFWVS